METNYDCPFEEAKELVQYFKDLNGKLTGRRENICLFDQVEGKKNRADLVALGASSGLTQAVVDLEFYIKYHADLLQNPEEKKYIVQRAVEIRDNKSDSGFNDEEKEILNLDNILTEANKCYTLLEKKKSEF